MKMHVEIQNVVPMTPPPMWGREWKYRLLSMMTTHGNPQNVVRRFQAQRQCNAEYIYYLSLWQRIKTYSMFHRGNSSRCKGETTWDPRKPHSTQGRKRDINEHQEWFKVLLTSINPSFDYRVRRNDELEIDEAPDYRNKYTYHLQCKTPLTAHVDEFQLHIPYHRSGWRNAGRYACYQAVAYSKYGVWGEWMSKVLVIVLLHLALWTSLL